MMTVMDRQGYPTRFEFLDPGPLVDSDLSLVLFSTRGGNRRQGLVPAYIFHMVHVDSAQVMGYISLRVGNTPHIMLYAGHIGYRVEPACRGRRYAARSCRLLMPLARRHGLNPLWITTNPDNIASRRSAELAGAQFVEIVALPRDTDMYLKGEREKCRYRLDL